MQIVSRWLLNSDKKCSLIALTANVRGAGVSTVTAGLARSFGTTNTGRVLLLDASGKRRGKPRPLDVTEVQDFSDLDAFIFSERKHKYDRIRLANIPHNLFGLGEDGYDFDDPAPAFDAVATPESLAQQVDAAASEAEAVEPEPDAGDEATVSESDDGGEGAAAADSDTSEAAGTDANLPVPTPERAEINRQTRRLLRRLKQDYDLILVDSGTMTNPSGTFWLVNSDANILVIDCTRTTREALEFQRHNSEDSGLAIDASILNKRSFPIPSFLYWLVK